MSLKEILNKKYTTLDRFVAIANFMLDLNKTNWLKLDLLTFEAVKGN